MVTPSSFKGIDDQKINPNFGTIENKNTKIVITENDIVNFVTKDTKFLKIVLFEYKEYHPKSHYFENLKNLISLYKQSSSSSFIITGHTDDIGSDSYNQHLSEKRVKSIEVFLIKNGIDAAKIKSYWKGESDPYKSNNTEEDRAKNRRVEVKLIGYKN